MKSYYSELFEDFFKIPQIPKHLFLLRSTFVIEEFDQYSILVSSDIDFWLFFGLKARGCACIYVNPFGSKHLVQKYAWKNYLLQMDFCLKTDNDESWPQ